ncbi:MAG TPA: YdeI/OmpD-associated family protein [Terriglobales bacterium]|nr:YdeI/OmpD-associated family protein [Terriglobales bacterium]
MAAESNYSPGDGPFRFKVRLQGMEGMETAALRPPFDVPTVFGTKARVPVRGTINGYPFRSSLCNMGSGHLMVVNKEMRTGAKCAAGDVVDVVLERDRAERIVKLPDSIKKALAKDKGVLAAWDALSFTHKKEWVRAIEGAKKEETRKSRIEKLISAMKAGKRVGF